MVKITFVQEQASKDDPIFSGRFVISSKNSAQESTSSMKTSSDDTDGASIEKSTPPSENQLKESLQSEESVSTSITQEEAFGRAMTLKLRLNREAREGKTAKVQQTTPQKLSE